MADVQWLEGWDVDEVDYRDIWVYVDVKMREVCMARSFCRSRCRCGRGRAQSRRRCGSGERSPDAEPDA